MTMFNSALLGLGADSKWSLDNAISEIILNKLIFFEKQQYKLISWVYQQFKPTEHFA